MQFNFSQNFWSFINWWALLWDQFVRPSKKAGDGANQGPSTEQCDDSKGPAEVDGESDLEVADAQEQGKDPITHAIAQSLEREAMSEGTINAPLSSGNVIEALDVFLTQVPEADRQQLKIIYLPDNLLREIETIAQSTNITLVQQVYSMISARHPWSLAFFGDLYDALGDQSDDDLEGDALEDRFIYFKQNCWNFFNKGWSKTNEGSITVALGDTESVHIHTQLDTLKQRLDAWVDDQYQSKAELHRPSQDSLHATSVSEVKKDDLSFEVIIDISTKVQAANGLIDGSCGMKVTDIENLLQMHPLAQEYPKIAAEIQEQLSADMGHQYGPVVMGQII